LHESFDHPGVTEGLGGERLYGIEGERDRSTGKKKEGEEEEEGDVVQGSRRKRS